MHLSHISTEKSHIASNLKVAVSELLKARAPFTVHVTHVGGTTPYKYNGTTFTSRMEVAVSNLIKRELAGVLK